MSVSSTITQLANILQGLSIPPSRIYTLPREAVNVADFPAVVIDFPDSTQGTLLVNNRGWYSHAYTLKIFLFVGALTLTPYDELNSRVMTWIDRLRGSITPMNMKVSGYALTGRDDKDEIEMKYVKGLIPWGDNQAGYYGLILTIQFYERFTDYD